MIVIPEAQKTYYQTDQKSLPYSYFVFFRDAGVVKTNSDIKEESLSITESLCSAGNFKVGLCEAATAGVTVYMEDNAEGDEVAIMQAQGDFAPVITYDPDKGIQLSGDDVELIDQGALSSTSIIVGDTNSQLDPSKYYLVLARLFYVGDEIYLYMEKPNHTSKLVYYMSHKQKGLLHIVNYSSSTTYNKNKKVRYSGKIYKSLVNSNTETPGTGDDWKDITAYIQIAIPIIGAELEGFYRCIYTNHTELDGYASIYEIKKPIMPLGLYGVDSSKKHEDISLRDLKGYDRMKAANLSADINYSFSEGDSVYIGDVLNYAANDTQIMVGTNLLKNKLNVERVSTTTEQVFPDPQYDPRPSERTLIYKTPLSYSTLESIGKYTESLHDRDVETGNTKIISTTDIVKEPLNWGRHYVSECIPVFNDYRRLENTSNTYLSCDYNYDLGSNGKMMYFRMVTYETSQEGMEWHARFSDTSLRNLTAADSWRVAGTRIHIYIVPETGYRVLTQVDIILKSVKSYGYIFNPEPVGEGWRVKSEEYLRPDLSGWDRIKAGVKRIYERNQATSIYEYFYKTTERYKIVDYDPDPQLRYDVRINSPLTTGAYVYDDELKNEIVGDLITDRQSDVRNAILNNSTTTETVVIDSNGYFNVSYISKWQYYLYIDYPASYSSEDVVREITKNISSPFIDVSFHSEEELFSNMEIDVSNLQIHTTRRSVIQSFLELNGLFVNFDRFGASDIKIMQASYEDLNLDISEIPLISTTESEIDLVDEETYTHTFEVTKQVSDLTLISSTTGTIPLDNPIYVCAEETQAKTSRNEAYKDSQYSSAVYDGSTVTYNGNTYTIDQMLDIMLADNRASANPNGIEFYVEDSNITPEINGQGYRQIVNYPYSSGNVTRGWFGYRLLRTETINNISYNVYQLWTYYEYEISGHTGSWFAGYYNNSDLYPTNRTISTIAQKPDALRNKIYGFDYVFRSSMSLYLCVSYAEIHPAKSVDITLETTTKVYQIPGYNLIDTYDFTYGSNKAGVKATESSYKSANITSQYSSSNILVNNEQDVIDAIDNYVETVTDPDVGGQITVTYLSKLTWTESITPETPGTTSFSSIFSSWGMSREVSVTGAYTYGLVNPYTSPTIRYMRRYGHYVFDELLPIDEPRSLSSSYYPYVDPGQRTMYFLVEAGKSDAVPYRGTKRVNEQWYIVCDYVYNGVKTFNGVDFNVYSNISYTTYNDQGEIEQATRYYHTPYPSSGFPHAYGTSFENMEYEGTFNNRQVITEFIYGTDPRDCYTKMANINFHYEFDTVPLGKEWEYLGYNYVSQTAYEYGIYENYKTTYTSPLIAETATVVHAKYKMPRHIRLNIYTPTFDPSKTAILSKEWQVYELAVDMGALDIDRQTEAKATLNAYPVPTTIETDGEGYFTVDYLSKINYKVWQGDEVRESGSFGVVDSPLLSCLARVFQGEHIDSNKTISLYINDNVNKPFDGIKILKSAEKTDAEMGLYPFYFNDTTRDDVSADMPQIGEWEGNNYYVISENFFISNFIFTEEQLTEICEKLMQRIGKLQYFNMTARLKALPSMEVGDTIIINTPGDSYNTALLRRTISGDSLVTDKIECNFYD
jgi:hypothetical protein